MRNGELLSWGRAVGFGVQAWVSTLLCLKPRLHQPKELCNCIAINQHHPPLKDHDLLPTGVTAVAAGIEFLSGCLSTKCNSAIP